MSLYALKNNNLDINESLNNPYSSYNQSNKISPDYKNDSTFKNSKIKVLENENSNELNNTNKHSEFNYNSHPYNTNPLKNTSLKNFASISKNSNNEYFSNNNFLPKTNYFQDFNLNDLHSKIMLEPIIIKDYFIQNIQKELKKNKSATELMDLKLLEFNILKEIIESCGSFPEKQRINFQKFLFSLPNDYYYFDLINKRGMHPFFKNLEFSFDLKDKFILNKLKNICSNIAYWSEEVGNVFFLPNIVYPFLKSFKGNDLFIFEILITLINCFCQYWFEYYPGAPLNHLKLCEKIIEKENPNLFKFFRISGKKEKERYEKERYDKKNLYKAKAYTNNNSNLNDPINLKITEISWKFMQSFYSESLDKTSWLQLIDYLACNSHRPEILLYINAALIMISDKLIMKCKTIEELYTLLFSQNLLKYPISSKNMLKVFKLANSLYEKYSDYQLYKYTPHIPFENGEYKMRINFPLDFLGTTAAIKEQIFSEENKLEEKKNQIDILENNFKELLKREHKIQRTYENMVHKEKEKAELIKRELDLIMFKKDQLNKELKEKKIEKIGRLQNAIDQSLHLYKKMNDNELKYFDEEIKARKFLEEFDIKSRLQQEELSNLEMEANRKMIDLLNLRNKDELMQKQKTEDSIRDKERIFNNKIHEEKWKIEDEAYNKNMENILNLKETQFLKLRDQNLYMEKLYKQRHSDFENKLYIQQVEKERLGRKGDFNNYGRTSIEENFLNSISKVSNKNNNFNNSTNLKNSSYQADNEMNNLIEELRKNMNNLELEEKALIEFEQELNKKQFEIKLHRLKKKDYGNENTNIDGSNSDINSFIISELNKIETEKQNCKNKKQDLEMRKQQINDNLNNLYNFNYQSQQANSLINSNNSGTNFQMKESNNFNNFTDTYGTNVNFSSNNNLPSLNSMNSSELRRLQKENQIREENERLYKKITNNNINNDDNLQGNENNNSKGNYSAMKMDSENKHSQSEALTSKFPYENSFGNVSPNNNFGLNNNSNNDPNFIEKTNQDKNQCKIKQYNI